MDIDKTLRRTLIALRYLIRERGLTAEEFLGELRARGGPGGLSFLRQSQERGNLEYRVLLLSLEILEISLESFRALVDPELRSQLPNMEQAKIKLLSQKFSKSRIKGVEEWESYPI